MRKTVAAAAMAASLTVGGAAGAALFAPQLVGAQDAAESTDAPAEAGARTAGHFVEDALAPLVEDGTITQDQADAVAEALAEARPEGRGHRPGHFGGGAAAEALGMTAEELRTALRDGQSIADVAEAQGVDLDDVIAAIVAEASERLDTAVENGRLTEEEAAEREAELTEKVTEFVERTPEDRPAGERRGPRGERPSDAPAEDADETTGS